MYIFHIFPSFRLPVGRLSFFFFVQDTLLYCLFENTLLMLVQRPGTHRSACYYFSPFPLESRKLISAPLLSLNRFLTVQKPSTVLCNSRSKVQRFFKALFFSLSLSHGRRNRKDQVNECRTEQTLCANWSNDSASKAS